MKIVANNKFNLKKEGKIKGKEWSLSRCWAPNVQKERPQAAMASKAFFGV